MKKYMIRYQSDPIDYEATIDKAQKLGIKPELGGGRDTKGGVSPNAQITLKPKNIDSKIQINRGGKIVVYYNSLPNLEKCLELVTQCCVSNTGNLNLRCLGPSDPFDLSFEFTITTNWNNTNLKCAQAKTRLYEWFHPKTGEYVYRLPDKLNRVVWPKGTGYIFNGWSNITITAVDKDDEKGNRVVTAERLVWDGVQELKRVTREHPRVRFEIGPDGKWRCH